MLSISRRIYGLCRPLKGGESRIWHQSDSKKDTDNKSQPFEDSNTDEDKMKFATMTVMVLMTASSLAKPKCKLERQFQVFGTERPISWQAGVGLTLIWDVPPSCPAAQPVLPISHQPRQNQAKAETAKIKVKPNKVRQEMGHPVQGVPCACRLGFVDVDFESSTVCPILLGLMGIWQKWLSTWARWWNIPNQSHPNR